VWISCRDDNKVVLYNTRTKQVISELAANAPSGIFFTSRAARIGF
jgi:protein NirF